jgi:cytochrome c-type biogenesis protein
MSSSISLFTAFVAGLASFLSPCVLPIVPGYLSFISGVNVAQLKGEEAPAHLMRRIGIMSVVFVLGFSTVFVSLGAAATMLGYYLQRYKRELAVVGGAVVVVLGLHTAGLIKIPWLLYERRAEMKTRQETVTQGVVLLSFYSAGLGIPFILSGLAVNRFFKASGTLKRHMRMVEVGSGMLLVAVGVLLMSGRLDRLAIWFSKMFPALTRIG